MTTRRGIRAGDNPRNPRRTPAPPNPRPPLPEPLPGEGGGTGADTARHELHQLGYDVSGYSKKELDKFWAAIPQAVKDAAANGDLFAQQAIGNVLEAAGQYQNPTGGSAAPMGSAQALSYATEQTFGANSNYTDAPYLLGPDATGIQRYAARNAALFDISNFTPESAAAILNNPSHGRILLGLTDDQMKQLTALAQQGGYQDTQGIYTPYTGTTSTQGAAAAPTSAYQYQQYPNYGEAMGAAQTALASHYASAAAAGDFQSAASAMDALERHNAVSQTGAFNSGGLVLESFQIPEQL